ncbi:hypothetical protein DFQ28_008013 [Apophysomyces sp. BC1034]|nr:hypothetical protein DFQ28_008013 [Apophysomyces sp. BC1034]
MLSFAIAFLISLLVTLIIVHYANTHQRLSTDTDLGGVQKFHVRPVPRIGGVGLLLGLTGSAVQLRSAYPAVADGILLLAGCGLPAFASGLIEDLTQRVSPSARLIATMAAAALAYWLLDAAIIRISVPWLDFALAYPWVSATISVLAVAGLANAINIIDGFNGLASMVSFMMFASLAIPDHDGRDHWLLPVEFSRWTDLSGRRGRVFHRLHAGGTGDPARDAQPRRFRMVSVAAVHVSDLRGLLLDLPQTVRARDVTRHPGRRASAHAGVQAADALGGWRAHCARVDPAQLADFAVSVAAMPGRGDPGDAVLATHRASVLLCRAVCGDLRVAVREHRALQGAALAGVS